MIELAFGSSCKICPSALRDISGTYPSLAVSHDIHSSHHRLRFSFVNVGIPPGAPGNSAAPQQASNAPPNTHMVSLTQVNTTKAPVLAQVFSDVFTVYSAKRFPGVVESTPLSKCFATQGIKIPIRKDGPGKGDKDRDDED